MIIWIQLIGLAALLLDVLSVQCKLRTHILGVQIIANITWVTHYLLLPGGLAGAVMNAVGLVRSISYYKWQGLDRPRWVPWMVAGLAVIATLVTWRDLSSIVPLLATLLAIAAFWQREEQRLRLLLLMSAPLWFLYNLLFLSYAGMASDTIALISTAIALYRYRKQGFHAANVYSRASSRLSKS